MLHLIAQTTQPSGDYGALFSALGSLLVAITGLLMAIKALRSTGVNQSNIQTLGAVAAASNAAINQSPGGFNVNNGAVTSAKLIASDPTTVAPAPISPEPVPAPIGSVRT